MTSRSDQATARTALPRIGVEEEFLLVDRTSRTSFGSAAAVVKRARDRLADRVGPEIFTDMVETRTRPVADLAGLRAELTELRAGVAGAADEAGCLALASGTAPLAPRGGQELTDEARYRRIADRYGPLVTAVSGIGVCGCHVHLEVADREEAVRLSNRLRPWLPALQSLAANSPFHCGRDSGYASWRFMRWAQLPGAGPAPLLADAAEYDLLVDRLVGSGMLVDRRTVYWHCRPNEHWPTLEVRVADVCAGLDTVLLLAGLLRGLAAALLTEVRQGVPAPEISDALLRAAHWRSARDGLAGHGLDPLSGTPRPAVELVKDLLAKAAPALAAAGEIDLVRELWARQRVAGCGAARQRAVFARRGRLADVVDEVALRADA
ncbi:glutamate--cysteine ligase [Streptomyces sp. NPDC053792]|uniref:glutamate--cysteine ligase n=1 Tax=Streptomyces sp. NPDC053792 TaxID=3365716 RepID=UPI0037CDC310